MRAAVILSILFAGAAGAQSDLPPEVIALSRIKQQMRANLAKLPDYTCIETVLRGRRDNDSQFFRLKDSLRVQVLHAGDKELYAWPGSKKFENSLASFTGGESGATSSGEFALHARNIFLGDAQYKYAGHVELRGRDALKYDYSIALFSSAMRLNYQGVSSRVSMSGSFWADAATLELLRLNVHAGDIPRDLPYRSAVSMVDYGRVRVGGNDVLLPQSADVELQFRDGEGDHNQIQFSQCRGFAAESEIRFDAPESAAAQDFTLPAGVELAIRLTQPIDSQTAKEGDPMEARVDAAVTRKNETIVPAGAVVHGRIRRLERYPAPRPHLIVGLEFAEIDMGGKHAVFAATLERADEAAHATWWIGSSGARRIKEVLGADAVPADEKTAAELPGVATFVVDGPEFTLPAGFHLAWRTIDLKKR